ncbi:MAG: hypothetical protein ACSNEK_05355 [Parachlamydiaceae bacterium]
MTIDPYLDFKWFDLWQWKEFNKENPEFIYLRYLDNENKKRWIKKIVETFNDIPLKTTFLTSVKKVHKETIVEPILTPVGYER